MREHAVHETDIGRPPAVLPHEVVGTLTLRGLDIMRLTLWPSACIGAGLRARFERQATTTFASFS